MTKYDYSYDDMNDANYYPFLNLFDYEQKKAIIYFLLLIDYSNIESDSNNYKFISLIEKILTGNVNSNKVYEIPSIEAYDLPPLNNTYWLGLFKNITQDQKEWIIVTLHSMVALKKEQTNYSISKAIEICLSIGITEDLYQKIIGNEIENISRLNNNLNRQKTKTYSDELPEEISGFHNLFNDNQKNGILFLLMLIHKAKMVPDLEGEQYLKLATKLLGTELLSFEYYSEMFKDKEIRINLFKDINLFLKEWIIIIFHSMASSNGIPDEKAVNKALGLCLAIGIPNELYIETVENEAKRMGYL